MSDIKLQLGCMLIVLYVTFSYLRERKVYGVRNKETIFKTLLAVGGMAIAMDGITAYTVNHLDTVPDVWNRIFHLLFLCSLDAIVFVMFLYIMEITGVKPGNRKQRLLLATPFVLNLIAVIVFIPELSYRRGEITNYSMGLSAYTCYIMLALYMVAGLVTLFRRRIYMNRHKVNTLCTYLVVLVAAATYQMIYPQALISCIVPTFAILGSYLNMENPLYNKLQTYNREMVMGFATLVENRDDNTGGHIKRTTEYVRILAEGLVKKGYYKETLTKDYINNLVMAAPMHDVGKIAIPDAVLQKPGKLTDEEYDIMKTHASRGGEIILETFGNMGDEEYEKMAYEVATYHHEKWNGRGYPEKRSGKDIPLCARIIAVADVFDAVSAKRCYRDALPLEECFEIIEKGSG